MEITPIFVVGIIFWTIYKVFDLFVRRRERLMLIEKINLETSGNLDINKISNLLNPDNQSDSRFTALKFGLLAVGLGLGLFIATLIINNEPEIINLWFMRSSLYGSLSLLGGGLGLVIAFIIEIIMRKSERKHQD